MCLVAISKPKLTSNCTTLTLPYTHRIDDRSQHPYLRPSRRDEPADYGTQRDTAPRWLARELLPCPWKADGGPGICAWAEELWSEIVGDEIQGIGAAFFSQGFALLGKALDLGLTRQLGCFD